MTAARGEGAAGAGAVLVQETREGAAFAVKAQPGARRTEVKGVHAGALKVAVAAPPEKGKANAALLRYLEEALGLGRGGLELLSGETSREKRVLARGLSAVALRVKLAGVGG